MISDERLEQIIGALCTDSLYDYEQVFDSIKNGEIGDMAKELLALRKAFSNPVLWEVKGIYCHSYEEAKSLYPDREPEALYEKPDMQ